MIQEVDTFMIILSVIKVLFYSGAKLEDMLNYSHAWCVRSKPRFVLVMGGICNMSIKHHRHGIELVYTSEPELLNHMCTVFTSAWEMARSLFPSSIVIFSGLCGMDLNRYNGFPGYHIHQPTIDRVIEQLNHHITDLNFRAGVFLPKLTSKVHRRSRSAGHRNQYRLLTDGIHPGPVVLSDWGKNIVNLYKLLLRNTSV